MENVSYRFVDTQPDLDALCRKLARQQEVALDSEADNLHHYETKLCLLQLRFEGQTYLLDVLAEIDLEEFWKTLGQLHLIMHGADFDLRLFREFCGFEPQSLFDSMLASQLLGIKRIGLAALLEERFRVKLPKDSQKSDWSQRPLSDKMLTYAANDVQYLYPLRDALLGEIRQKGREEWLAQRCQNQIQNALSGFPEHHENSWRISKAERLDPRGQAAVYELWHWRESLAERLDRPPFKILGNNFILQLAEAVSEGNHEYVFEQLPMGIRRRKRQGLLEALRAGAERDVSTLPKRPRRSDTKGPLSQRELERQEKIKSFRDKIAADFDIDPTLIATRSVVAQLARDPRDTEGLLDWQLELLRPCLERSRESLPDY